jgi:hypothetical protein
LAALLEAVHDFSQPTAKDPACTSPAKTAFQLAEQAAEPTFPGSSGRALSESTEHLSDLVPVLVARDRKQSQEGSHGWKTTAHQALLLLSLRSGTTVCSGISSTQRPRSREQRNLRLPRRGALYDNTFQQYGQIFIMNADGSEKRALTDNRWEDSMPLLIPAKLL